MSSVQHTQYGSTGQRVHSVVCGVGEGTERVCVWGGGGSLVAAIP